MFKTRNNSIRVIETDLQTMNFNESPIEIARVLFFRRVVATGSHVASYRVALYVRVSCMRRVTRAATRSDVNNNIIIVSVRTRIEKRSGRARRTSRVASPTRF